MDYKNFWLWNDKLEAKPGATIGETIKEAINIAHGGGKNFQFEFNTIKIIVAPDSDASLIYRDWDRAMQGCINKEIGPYPKDKLTEEEKDSDSRIEAENERKRQRAQENYDLREKAKRKAVDTRLFGSPAIELTDEKYWQEMKAANQDGYGGAVIIYAELWARLMQVDMAEGAKLEDIAESTSYEADADIGGLTGFMYGCAVSILSKCWKHGERLRRWHNLKTQIRDEGERANRDGGILNPAILTLGAKR